MNICILKIAAKRRKIYHNYLNLAILDAKYIIADVLQTYNWITFLIQGIIILSITI